MKVFIVEFQFPDTPDTMENQSTELYEKFECNVSIDLSFFHDLIKYKTAAKY